MNDTLYLAWRYLVFNRGKTIVLVASLFGVKGCCRPARRVPATEALDFLPFFLHG